MIKTTELTLTKVQKWGEPVKTELCFKNGREINAENISALLPAAPGGIPVNTKHKLKVSVEVL